MSSEVYLIPFLSVMASVVLVIASLYWAKAVLIPLALALMLTFLLQPIVAALHRRGLGHMTAVAEEARFIYQSTSELVDNLGAAQSITSAAEVPVVSEEDAAAVLPPKVRMLVCPAHDEADAVALQMLQQVLDPMRFVVECTKSTLLTAEVLSLVEQATPALVCIGLVPPRGLRPDAVSL